MTQRENPRILLTHCKSEGQRSVFKALVKMEMAVERYGGCIGEFKLRRSALIYGMSGVGKSWMAELFSRYLGIPHYSTTVGGWSLSGGFSNHKTMEDILGLLAKSPLCIVIDECDKFSGKKGDINSSYFRAILNEIMSLAMASLNDFKPSEAAIENLNKSWLLFCGTWQDLYKQIDNPEDRSITPDDLIDRSGLPDELINRTGLLLEIAQPNYLELAISMNKIEQEAGVILERAEREAKAREYVKYRKGFRGLQDYALAIAMRGVNEEIGARRFPCPTPQLLDCAA